MKAAPVYKLVVAYDGTRYGGWQVQPNRDTIQARIETASAKLFGGKLSIQGAGRTDAGVHAKGQVASFRASRALDTATLARALNGNLPEDIRVLRATGARDDFHARISATSKEYRYHIVNAPVMDPLLRLHAFHHPRVLNLGLMKEFARMIIGKHDFAALASNPHREVESTVRTVTRLTITRRGPLLTISIRADGFLYKMARTIVGALLQAGRGDTTPRELKRYVQDGQRTHFVVTAPPHGLCLWKVWY